MQIKQVAFEDKQKKKKKRKKKKKKKEEENWRALYMQLCSLRGFKHP